MRPARRLATVLLGLVVLLGGSSLAMSHSPVDFGDLSLVYAMPARGLRARKEEFEESEGVGEGLGRSSMKRRAPRATAIPPSAAAARDSRRASAG